MEDLHLYVQVVIITSTVVISGCCFSEDRTELFRSASAACAARLFVLTRPIEFLICDVFTAVPAVEAVAHFYQFFFCFRLSYALINILKNVYRPQRKQSA